MAIEPRFPEIPYPLPPERPPLRTTPLMVPMVPIRGGDVWDRLADQRRILISGPLDGEAIRTLAARLMAFDGESSRDVEIVINSRGGPLAEIFSVLDVVQLMRARTNTTCVGVAAGTAAALVACGTGHRRAAPNATICLRIDDEQSIHGTSRDLARQAEEAGVLRTRLIETLTAATGLDRDRIGAEVERGRFLTATEARDLGIVDAVEGPATAQRTDT